MPQDFHRWVIGKAADLVTHVRRAQMDAASEGFTVFAVCLSDQYMNLDWGAYVKDNPLVIGEVAGPVEKIGDTQVWYDSGVPAEMVRLIQLRSDIGLIPESKE